jgi:hypothetical protein
MALGDRNGLLANFHTVWINAQTLCFECKGCRRRAALGKADIPEIRQGSIKYVRDTKFRCSRCQNTLAYIYIPFTQEEATMFLAGDPMPDGREIW